MNKKVIGKLQPKKVVAIHDEDMENLGQLPKKKRKTPNRDAYMRQYRKEHPEYAKTVLQQSKDIYKRNKKELLELRAEVAMLRKVMCNKCKEKTLQNNTSTQNNS